MPSGCLDAANFLLVNPLLDRGEANPQLQSSITELQQLAIFRRGFTVPRHRNEIVQSTQGTVNEPAPRSVYLKPSGQRKIKPHRNGYDNRISYTILVFCQTRFNSQAF